MSKMAESPVGIKSYIIEIVKAVIIALIISLIGVLIAAFAIKLFNLSTEFTIVVNQVIKTVAVLLGCLFSLKHAGNGWIRGIIVGLIFSLVSYLVFSIIGGEFTFDISFLNNTVIGISAGLVSGIISMFIRKN